MSHQPSSVSFRYYRNSLEREIRNNDKTFLRYHQEIWLLFEFDIRKFPISWKSLLPTAGDESKKIKLFVQPHTRKLLHDGEQFVSYFVFSSSFPIDNEFYLSLWLLFSMGLIVPSHGIKIWKVKLKHELNFLFGTFQGSS